MGQTRGGMRLTLCSGCAVISREESVQFWNKQTAIKYYGQSGVSKAWILHLLDQVINDSQVHRKGDLSNNTRKLEKFCGVTRVTRCNAIIEEAASLHKISKLSGGFYVKSCIPYTRRDTDLKNLLRQNTHIFIYKTYMYQQQYIVCKKLTCTN